MRLWGFVQLKPSKQVFTFIKYKRLCVWGSHILKVFAVGGLTHFPASIQIVMVLPISSRNKSKHIIMFIFLDLVFLCMKICRRRLMEVSTRLLTRYHFHSPCIAKCLIPCDRQTLLCCRTHQPHHFRSQTTNFLCLIRIPRHNLFTFVPDGKYRLKAWTLRSV